MTDDYMHPGEREAERLRVIIETLATASPEMTMFVAAPTIFEIEKKTAEMEKVQWDKALAASRPVPSVTLPDSSPETAARFVALCKEIQDHLPHKKINAIKELRARTGLGLKEAKDGVEHFEKYGTASAPVSSSRTGPYHGMTPTASNVADWIESIEHTTHMVVGHLRDVLDGRGTSPKIKAIKEVRADCPMYPGLKEAKEGVEEYLSRKGHTTSVF